MLYALGFYALQILTRAEIYLPGSPPPPFSYCGGLEQLLHTTARGFWAINKFADAFCK